MVLIRTLALTIVCLLTASAVIGGQPVAKILTMLGAKRELGATDEQLLSYVRHFDRTDPNHDGQHTREEYVERGGYMMPQARAGIFRAADDNADGVVTRTEYVLNRIITDEAKGIIQGIDADDDGQVTRAEFVEGSRVKDEFRGPTHVFTTADKDKNGRVTRAEMEAFRARTAEGGPGGSSPYGSRPARTKFTTPHALDPKTVKEGHNLVVDGDGEEAPPQGRPIQQGYRLVRVDRVVEEPNVRAYATVFSIMAPIRDTLIHHVETTSQAQWKQLTAILEKNDIKTRQWLKGPTPRDNYYSSRGIFDHLKSTYSGKIPAGAVPGNVYTDRDYHSMMKYLEEAELELKCRTFSPDFDFTNPEGVNPCPKPDQFIRREYRSGWAL